MTPEGDVPAVCAACGAVLAEGEPTCPSCGAPTMSATGALTLTSLATAAPIVLESGPVPTVGSNPALDLPHGSMALMVVRGSDEGRRIVLETTTIIGRAHDSGVFLDDVTVSRNHVELTHDGQAWVLRDLGSLNGTYVNRRRVDSVTLAAGDEVQVGKYRFIVQLSGL
jgi:hypothetical protein